MSRRRLPSSGAGRSIYRSFPGALTFLDLGDTPNSYAGAGSKFVAVNVTATGLEFIPLPPLAITDTFVVNSQANMLALTAQRGDVAVRTDINQTFILAADDPTILANWVLLLVSPTHALAGALHTADTITNLNLLLSDGSLITTKAAEINALTAKATPTTSDLLIIEDAAAANAKKKITIGSLPAAAPAIHSFIDNSGIHSRATLADVQAFALVSGQLFSSYPGQIVAEPDKLIPTGLDWLLIEDAADSDKKKRITISRLPAAAPAAHALAGLLHNADTIPNLQSKISGGFLITSAAFEMWNLPDKAVPIGTDILLIEDHSDGDKKKKVSISNLPAAAPAAHALAGALHSSDTITNLNTKLSDGSLITSKAAEINALTNKATAAYSDLILIESAADANAKRKLPVSGLLEAVRSNFYPADALMSPISGWALNTMAVISADATYNETLVRNFNDSTEQGIGIQFYIPAGVTNLIIEFFGRAATAPGTAKAVLMSIYTRNHPLNAAQTAWTGRTNLTALAIPTNAYWQNYQRTASLASLSLTADNMAMLEFTRNAADASDTLVGDFNLTGIKIYFS